MHETSGERRTSPYAVGGIGAGRRAWSGALWDAAAMTSRTAPILLLASIGALGLAACSSSDATSSTSAAPASASASASPIGGMTTCDVAALNQPVADAVAADSSGMKLDQISDLQCGDGWAAVGADVSSSSATADPDTGITITLVFEQEGQFWVPKDRTAVCGTPSTADPASRPDDAQVPASIWLAACNTN